MLRRLRAENHHTAVFCHADGSYLDPSTVTHQFSRIAQKAGFPDLRFHDLRHTYATILLSRGVQAKVVQELLGHESITTTIDIYAHVVESLQRGRKAIGTYAGVEWWAMKDSNLQPAD